MTKYTGIIAALFFVNWGFAKNEISQVDSIIKASIKLNPEIGISVGLLSQNDVCFLNYGYTNRTEKTKIDENSIFEIGSITKLFTSYLISQQVELGNIYLDSTIDNYLPHFFTLNLALKHKIKVSDLASHQSGLPDFDFKKLLLIDPSQPLDLVTKETVDSILTNTTQLASYGGYQYSNISYVLLGYILENVLKKDYEDIIKDKILTPFKMSNTLCADYYESNLTQGYDIEGIQKDFFNWNSVIAPAGLLKSNSADMLKFIKQLLSKKNKAVRNLLEQTYFKNTIIELGLGLNIIRDNENVVFVKTGDTLGQSSVLAYNPKKKLGIVILTTQANGVARKVFNQILEI